jgi:hypothetical protein
MPIVPNMARSHFEHIARIISALPRDCTRAEVASAFAEALRPTNRTFNQAKFLAACQGFSDRASSHLVRTVEETYRRRLARTIPGEDVNDA